MSHPDQRRMKDKEKNYEHTALATFLYYVSCYKLDT